MSFYRPLETFPSRESNPALIIPFEVYERLRALQVGDLVPSEVYISDYDTGTIPPWIVEAKQERSILVVLTLIDANAKPYQEYQGLFASEKLQVAIQVFCSPAKALASPMFMYGKPGYGPKNMLHDLIQQVRIQNKTRRKAG